MKIKHTASEDDFIGCSEMSVRIFLSVLFFCASVSVSLPLTGCTYTRSGSILPDVKLIEINDSLNGSANGNTVTPGGF